LTLFEVLGVENALRSAERYRLLRKRGITIRKTVDVIIATFCIVENHMLLFSDKDFVPFVEHLNLRGVT
jgi:predicted nucleic acid-binding protein